MFDPIEKPRILVLEDDEVDRMQIKRLLAKSSLSQCEVDYAVLLSDVLQKLQKSSFQVILSDLNVPDSAGIKTLTEMNKKCPDAAIITITGLNDKELGRKAISEGAQDYLVKGEFDEFDLSKAIEHAVHRKQAEIRIKQQNNFLNNILESLTNPFYVLDANDYKIIIANSAASAEKTSEQTCYMLSHKFDKPCEGPYYPCPLQEVKRTKKPVTLEHVHKDKDGNVRYYEFHAYPLFDDSGQVVKIIEYSLDITGRKQAEKDREKMETQLRQAQKMEAIGTLAGGIAHDFNNMLGAMMGYANLVLQDIPEDSITHRNQEEVLTAANRAKDLVKQILTFGREAEEEKKSLHFAGVVSEAVKTIKYSLPKNIKLRENYGKSDSFIMANVMHIHRILLNLCTNASDAMSAKGGILEISINDIDIESDMTVNNTLLPKGQYARLSVSDTGSGISPEVLDRIFEPFFTTKEVGKGTGMGLSVVHGITKKCKAFIGVESKMGEGTTFHVFFPKIKVADIKPSGQNESESNQCKGVILLVDDEPVMVDVTTQILKRMEYRIVGTTSSIDALELFQSQPDKFDLVITDHRMPQMTGTQLAQKLLAIRIDIPIILCTGFSEDIHPEEAKKMGIKEYLMKPVTNKELNETIEKLLSRTEVAV